MSVPKQRHTKGRQKRRRANIKITAKNLIACSHCKRRIKPHEICSYCGYYKGKEVIDMSKKKTKKKKKK